MHTNTTIRPGQRGAKKFADQYGDRLVCVRYRQDEVRQKRLKTIEVIVEEWPWTPPPPQRKSDSLQRFQLECSGRIGLTHRI